MQPVWGNPDEDGKPQVGQSLYVVITGLPASGKTTLGRRLAERLGVDFFDKDDYLESLFGNDTPATEETRQALSRISDKSFIADARASHAAVLVSHWRPPQLDTQSGTPVDWIDAALKRVIQVCCVCPPEIAAQRFILRRRHPGHADNLRPEDKVLQWMEDYAAYLPLDLGMLVEVDTHSGRGIGDLEDNIRALLPG